MEELHAFCETRGGCFFDVIISC